MELIDRIRTTRTRDRCGRILPDPPDHFADQKAAMSALADGPCSTRDVAGDGSLCHAANVLNTLKNKGLVRREGDLWHATI